MKDKKKNGTALATAKRARSTTTPIERQAAALRANAKAIKKPAERAALNRAAASYEARAKVERKQ